MEHFIVKRETGVVGTIPSTFGKISGLRQLGLNHNQLIGPIPSMLYSLANLRYLNLENNELMGSLLHGDRKAWGLRNSYPVEQQFRRGYSISEFGFYEYRVLVSQLQQVFGSNWQLLLEIARRFVICIWIETSWLESYRRHLVALTT